MKCSGLMILALAAALAGGPAARAAEVIPPAPKAYFNDYAHAVSPDVAAQLDNKLADFEKQTSNQIWVVVYPHMQSDSSIEDYCTRVFEAWRVGQKGLSNGVVLFVFSDDHRMRIQTGYGLEGALPDILCKQIMDNEIAPRFKANDYAGGLAAGVDAILAATKGEYKARTNPNAWSAGAVGFFILAAMFAPFILVFLLLRLGGVNIGSKGSSSSSGWSGWSSGSGGWSSGGGGGGGFSGGGGGSTGGGGASGSW